MPDRPPSFRRDYPAAFFMVMGLIAAAGLAILAAAAASFVLWLTG